MTFVTLIKIVPGKAKEVFSPGAGMVPPAGVTIKQIYVTYGRFDLVAVWEVADMAAANRCAKWMASQGIATTETLLAQPLEEFVQG